MERVAIIIPKGAYENYDAVDKVISYIMRLNDIRLVGGYGIIPTSAKDISEQFHKVKYYYGKTGEKQIRHYVFSVEKTLHFSAWEIKELGYLLGLYFGNEHQVVFAVHDDSKNLHIHMGINTVAYTNGAYRAYWEIGEMKAYAEKCVDVLIDKVWFGKENAAETLKVPAAF